ncbi:hypothetical protein PMAYCL1PPCAC_10760, partial [Pristionchus mayeri]
LFSSSHSLSALESQMPWILADLASQEGPLQLALPSLRTRRSAIRCALDYRSQRLASSARNFASQSSNRRSNSRPPDVLSKYF